MFHNNPEGVHLKILIWFFCTSVRARNILTLCDIYTKDSLDTQTYKIYHLQLLNWNIQILEMLPVMNAIINHKIHCRNCTFAISFKSSTALPCCLNSSSSLRKPYCMAWSIFQGLECGYPEVSQMKDEAERTARSSLIPKSVWPS